MKTNRSTSFLAVAGLLVMTGFISGCSCQATNLTQTSAAASSNGSQTASSSTSGVVPVSTTAVQTIPVTTEPSTPLVMADPIFEKLLKAELKKDVIYPEDLDIYTRIIIGGDHFISLSGGDIKEKSIILFFGTEVEFEDTRYKGFGTMKSLADLGHFKNLNVLDVTLQPEIDYSTIPPETLAKLTRVFLTQSKLKDLSFLKGATSMFSLSLSFNEVSDLTPLKSCKELIYLSCGSNQLEDLSPLAELTKLKRIDMTQNNVKDLTPLKNLVSLEVLGCYQNQIEDISALSGLTNLKDLELIDNKIKDISPLKDFKSFKRLRLRGNPIENIEVLDHIENLEME